MGGAAHAGSPCFAHSSSSADLHCRTVACCVSPLHPWTTGAGVDPARNMCNTACILPRTPPTPHPPSPWPRPTPLQIGHAGEGGLYAELVQDRSFDALAAATGFHASPDPRLPLDLPMLAATHRAPDVPVPPPTWDSGASFSSKGDYLKAQQDRLGAGHDPRCAWGGEGLGGEASAGEGSAPARRLGGCRGKWGGQGATQTACTTTSTAASAASDGSACRVPLTCRRCHPLPRPATPSPTHLPTPATPPPAPLACSNDIIVAWQALPGTTATLTKDQPLNDRNPVAMELRSGTGGSCV